MKTLDLEQDSIAARAFLWAIAATAALVIAVALLDASIFPISKLAILGTSVLLLAFVSRWSFELPVTGGRFTPKALFAFWGTIWLGIPGGVLLGAAASAASESSEHRSLQSLLARVAADTLKSFAAAIAFYFALGYVRLPGKPPAVSGLALPYDVILASAAMAGVYYAAGTLLSGAKSGERNQPRSNAGTHFQNLAAAAFALVATALLFLVFNHFGIEFGLVLFPLAVAVNAAYKMHTRRLEQKTRQISEASRMHLATVEALATAIDARDQVGMGHVRRTQIYAVGLGTELGLPESDIDALRNGALLHDIGKLAVPDHILNKPGKLTPAEMEKTKIHSSVGAAILANVGFPTPVVPTVKYHHEFWNGGGYPEGLRGDEIPLTARILSIADAFDTLRGDRPYRRAVSRDEACNFLRSRAGTQFDPHLVSRFLQNLNVFEREIDVQALSYGTASAKRSADRPADAEPFDFVEQIQNANREVFTLYSLATEFSSALDIEETLGLFTQKIGEFVPFDTCLVYIADDGGVSATAVHATGLHAAQLRGRRVVIGEGATGYAFKQRKPVSNVDPALDFAFSHGEIGNQYVSMASLPMVAENSLVGGITLYSTSLPGYEDEHMRLIETFTRIAADAVSKSMQHAQAAAYALTDPMTGLPNARSLHIHFDKEVKRASRAGAAFQFLMLDLDGFKAVNDTFGHKVGDRLLKDVATIIRHELREYDFLARYAGDEFVAIVPETDSHGVLELCRRIEAAVKAFSLPVGEAGTARVGVSIGSACYPNHGESFDQVLIAADKAMYLTKAVRKQRSETQASSHPNAAPKRINQTNSGAFLAVADEPASDVKVVRESQADELILEVDESHIVSSAVN